MEILVKFMQFVVKIKPQDFEKQFQISWLEIKPYEIT